MHSLSQSALLLLVNCFALYVHLMDHFSKRLASLLSDWLEIITDYFVNPGIPSIA